MRKLCLSNLQQNSIVKDVCISNQREIRGGGYRSIHRNTISGNRATSFVLEEDSNGVVKIRKTSKNIGKKQIGNASIFLSASSFGPHISILKNGIAIKTQK